MLTSLPTLAPRCVRLDLTGSRASDQSVAGALSRLAHLREVILDGCHRVSTSTAQALVDERRDNPVELVSLQRCFGLVDGAALLALALGWWRRLPRSAPLRHPPPRPGIRLPVSEAPGHLTTLSLTCCAFQCSAAELVRAVAAGAPRLEVLGVGGSSFGARVVRERGEGRAADELAARDVDDRGDDDDDDDDAAVFDVDDVESDARRRAEVLAEAFVALRNFALEVTFAHPEDPFGARLRGWRRRCPASPSSRTPRMRSRIRFEPTTSGTPPTRGASFASRRRTRATAREPRGTSPRYAPRRIVYPREGSKSRRYTPPSPRSRRTREKIAR